MVSLRSRWARVRSWCHVALAIVRSASARASAMTCGPSLWLSIGMTSEAETVVMASRDLRAA
eukprot:417553-Pyramimonas_sp.AAC.1